MNILSVPPLEEDAVDRSLAEMDRLGQRDYAEIGVPMFLVAEDLTGAPMPRQTGDMTGRILAMLLAEGAEAMRRRKPELTAKDVARLVESLADRHFLSLATPAFSRTTELHPGT